MEIVEVKYHFISGKTGSDYSLIFKNLNTKTEINLRKIYIMTPNTLKLSS